MSHSNQSASELKTFAFRCEWIDKSNNPDGFTYAITGKDLEEEIIRRQNRCGGKAIKRKVVLVRYPFWEMIKSRKVPVYSTVEGKHPDDVEKFI
jgi:hypothetical protein